MARDYARNRSSRRNARIAELTPRGGRRPSGQRRLNAYRQPRRPRTLLWLATGILLGFLLAGGLYLKTCSPNHETKNLANKNKSTVNSSEKHSENSDTTNLSESEDPEISEIASAQTENTSSTHKSGKSKLNKIVKKNNGTEEPQYEFYTMLSKNTVETPKSKNTETSTEKPTDKPTEKAIEKSQNKNATNNHYQLQVASFSKLQDADRLKAELILQGHNATIQKQQINKVVHYRVFIGPFNSSKEAHAKQQDLSKNKIKSIAVPTTH